MHPRTEDKAAQGFTEARTRELLFKACCETGLNPDGAKLLRHQTNAVYLLESDRTVVKIARPDYDIEHVKRTVDLTRWLLGQGFPTVPLCDIAQPVIADGSAVTFWRYLPQTYPISAADIAEPLRRLHKLPAPPLTAVPELPRLDAVSAIRYSIDREHILSEDDHGFLLERCESLKAVLNELRYERHPCLLHGDPQHGNALRDGLGTVLCDWESAVIGPSEWDLVTIEIHCRRFSHPPETYSAFCRIYGRDIREWDGFPWLRDLRELRMIATNARKSASNSRGAAEVRQRVAQLQLTGPAGRWSIL